MYLIDYPPADYSYEEPKHITSSSKPRPSALHPHPHPQQLTSNPAAGPAAAANQVTLPRPGPPGLPFTLPSVFLACSKEATTTTTTTTTRN
ncbi:hypothetical protein HJFPF1_04535 [Paramyrothecium foliicola]|nr:hypothetical protein HJFPF1_04535 [Paramyrothecium foliicola]